MCRPRPALRPRRQRARSREPRSRRRATRFSSSRVLSLVRAFHLVSIVLRMESRDDRAPGPPGGRIAHPAEGMSGSYRRSSGRTMPLVPRRSRGTTGRDRTRTSHPPAPLRPAAELLDRPHADQLGEPEAAEIVEPSPRRRPELRGGVAPPGPGRPRPATSGIPGTELVEHVEDQRALPRIRAGGQRAPHVHEPQPEPVADPASHTPRCARSHQSAWSRAEVRGRARRPVDVEEVAPELRRRPTVERDRLLTPSSLSGRRPPDLPVVPVDRVALGTTARSRGRRGASGRLVPPPGGRTGSGASHQLRSA